MTLFKKGICDFGGAVLHSYVIESLNEIETSDDGSMSFPLYWSNDEGWVPFFACDRFSYEEAKELNRPQDSVWVSCMSSSSFTAVDSSYVSTEVTSLIHDPDLEVGKPSEIDPM
jgi:hypothetical protein